MILTENEIEDKVEGNQDCYVKEGPVEVDVDDHVVQYVLRLPLPQLKVHDDVTLLDKGLAKIVNILFQFIILNVIIKFLDDFLFVVYFLRPVLLFEIFFNLFKIFQFLKIIKNYLYVVQKGDQLQNINKN